MSKLSKATVAVNGLLPALASLIQKWHPATAKSEREYRNLLFDFLTDALPDDARLEREYRDAGTTADLYLHWSGMFQSDEVFFELKKDLTRKSDFDRLVGQIEQLDPGKHNVVVVLCGNTDSALEGRLREKYAHHLDALLFTSMLILSIRSGGSAT